MKFPMDHNWIRTLVLTQVAGLTMVACALAQNAPPRQAPPQRQVPGQAGTQQAVNLDAQIAACLILENQNEVAAAQLAAKKSESPEVKKFAEKLEQDHQQFISELEKVVGRNPFPDRIAKAGEKPGSETEQRVTARRVDTTQTGARKGPYDVHLQIKHEIADQCLATAEKELNSKQGREFDACYVGMQLGMHMYMVDELKVLERHASPKLQATLRKGQQVAQMHLDRAKEIMKDIDKGETKTTGRSTTE